MTVLRYGINSSVVIESAEATGRHEPDVPRDTPLADPGEAASAALNEPLDYPPLAKSTTPGDRVVLALDRGVPKAAEVAAAVVHALVRSGIGADGIAVLLNRTDGDAKTEDPCRLVNSDHRNRIRVLTHDPADRKQLAYLAAGESGEAILVNRALHEADIVLPIGCLHDDRAAGYYGIHGAVYPTFSDTKTIQRFRGLGSLDASGDRKRELTDQVDHVAWLLGVNLTIQVIPGGGGRIMHVLAGQSDSVRRRGRELYDAVWSRTVSRQAGLVVAAIEGPAIQQTWENLGRALQVAGSFVEDGGAIAVCCDLSARPGPAMRRLASESSRAESMRHVGRHRPVDALPAAQLAHALDRNKVYLLSRLDPSTVEDLNMVPLEKPKELSRLARQYSSCTLLSNAQYIMPVVE
ncbi:MAG: DUF2088 domain-containing protein [Planctomycetes bacterium]|nr:DUF2088 domain-containing protein [Planctomycetota bacterium]MBU4398913.1 DUF2088 domain-containing protein [Planctomycetota bacterium]MCG2684447.1 lactate racemase domain-containing protein [Planctomycetales bacterium]